MSKVRAGPGVKILFLVLSIVSISSTVALAGQPRPQPVVTTQRAVISN